VKRTALVGVLLALTVLAIAGFELADRAEASIEGSVRRYAAAVTDSDLDAAMAEIAPDQRERWTDWVQDQLGNVYDVRGIAVRSPSILERVSRRMPGGPNEVTTFLDVDRDYPDEFYQPTTRVDVEQFQGHWYLAAPLLASE
jgi:hypothetical protein